MKKFILMLATIFFFAGIFSSCNKNDKEEEIEFSLAKSDKFYEGDSTVYYLNGPERGSFTGSFYYLRQVFEETYYYEMSNGQFMVIRAAFPAAETGFEEPDFLVFFDNQKPAVTSVPNKLNSSQIASNKIELKLSFNIEGKKYIQHFFIE